MNMQNYYEICWKKYFDFRGRACRKEYWSFVLINLVIYTALRITSQKLNQPIICRIYELLIFIPSLSVTCRRLHDINRSGWWQLLQMVLPWVLIIVMLFLIPKSPILAIVGVIAILFAVLLVIVAMMVRKGTVGKNRFGADPIAEDNADDIAGDNAGDNADERKGDNAEDRKGDNADERKGDNAGDNAGDRKGERWDYREDDEYRR